MSKRKIVISTIIILLFLCFIGVGAYSIITTQKYKNNDVVFNLENSTSYCEVKGKFFLGQNAIDSNTATFNYSDSYTEGEYYGTKSNGLDAWSIGRTSFVEDQQHPENNIDIMKFEISIKNLNDAQSGVPLEISLYDVAVHETIDDGQTKNYFYTKITYQINDGQKVVKFNNNPADLIKDAYVQNSNKVNIATIQEIQAGQTLNITIEFKLNTKTKNINTENNIKINIKGKEVD